MRRNLGFNFKIFFAASTPLALGYVYKQYYQQEPEPEDKILRYYHTNNVDSGEFTLRSDIFTRSHKNTESALKYYQELLDTIQANSSPVSTSSKVLCQIFEKISELQDKIGNKQQALIALGKSLEWRFKEFDQNDEYFVHGFYELIQKLEDHNLVQQAKENCEWMIPVLASLELGDNPSSQLSPSFVMNLHSLVLEKIGLYHLLRSEREYNKEALNQAVDYFKSAIQKAEQRDYSDYERLGNLHYQIARAKHALKQFDATVDECQQTVKYSSCLKKKQAENSENPNSSATSLYVPIGHCAAFLGFDFMYRNEQDQAIPLLEESVRVLGQAVGTTSKPAEEEEEIKQDEYQQQQEYISEKQYMRLKYGELLTNLGVVYLKSKQFGKAVETTRKGLAVLENEKGNKSHDALSIKLNLAIALYESGEMEEGIKLNQEVLKSSKAQFGEAHPLTQQAKIAFQSYTLG